MPAAVLYCMVLLIGCMPKPGVLEVSPNFRSDPLAFEGSARISGKILKRYILVV